MIGAVPRTVVAVAKLWKTSWPWDQYERMFGERLNRVPVGGA